MVADTDKFKLMQAIIAQASFPDAHIVTLDGLRVEFAEGWGLIRPSNTTPCFVLRFEANSREALTNIQTKFQQLLSSVDDSLVIEQVTMH